MSKQFMMYFISSALYIFYKPTMTTRCVHENQYFFRKHQWQWTLNGIHLLLQNEILDLNFNYMICYDHMKVIMIKMSSYTWIKIITDSHLLIYTLCEYKCWGGMVLLNFSISGNLVMWYNVLIPLVIICMTEPAGRINSHLEWSIIRVTFASYVTKPVLYP